jgi:hypothetical protein
MRRTFSAWIFVPVACLAVFVCSLYLGHSDAVFDNSALLRASPHHSKAEFLLKKLNLDLKHVVHADHELHVMAASSLPHDEFHGVISQRKSSEAAVSVDAAPASIPSSQRRNRPGVAQHFVQLARQWVARIEPLQRRLAPLQHELDIYDRSIALVKQHLAEAESQRDAVKAVVESSLDSVEAAQRLFDSSQAQRLELQHKLVHVANQISAASGAPVPRHNSSHTVSYLPLAPSAADAFEAGKSAAADAALKYSLAQERIDPTPADELAKRLANGRASSTANVAAVPVLDSHSRDLAVINSAIDSREVKHVQLDEYSDQPDDQPFRSSWKPVK